MWLHVIARIKPGVSRAEAEASANVLYHQILTEELIPYIDATFRTQADQPHRAMAGLSMGGMQTRQITLANRDKFSHIGLFSGGVINTNDVSSTPGFREKAKVVFASCGSRENPGNINGGTAKPDDFKLTVNGSSVLSGAKNTFKANTALAINETQLAGYTFIGITGRLVLVDADRKTGEFLPDEWHQTDLVSCRE